MPEEAKKKSKITLFTHFSPKHIRTYQYNYEYAESYYRPLVQYISTSRALRESQASSSRLAYETRLQKLERRRRAATPPGALSFIERWSNEPFYGRGIGFRSRQSVDRVLSSSSASATAVSASSAQMISSQLESMSSSSQIRSRRARSVEAVSRYASDDCLMRSTALERAASIAREMRGTALERATSIAREMRGTSLEGATSATRDIMDTQSLTKRTLHLDDRNVLHGRTLDERYYLDYPKQHLVCPDHCPLHNRPEWRRRFLIGNRFMDAAALGGFDVLYDPTVYDNARRLVAKMALTSHSESDEIIIQRSSESESSRMRMRASVA